MTPQELWEVFEEAASECPQFRGINEDATEQGFLPYSILKKSYNGVISYWLNSESLGGHLIVSKGYDESLPSDVISMCQEYNRLMAGYQKKAAQQAFGSK